MDSIKSVAVKVESMELIKPSSPTPHNLCHHQLSSQDQLSSSLFMPLVLFFTADPKATIKINHTQRCNLLKQSLSKTLTHFYALAGRVRDNMYIDCNDEGVHFVEARIDDTMMSEFLLQDPSPGHLNEFLAFKHGDANDLLAAFQATCFKCGGMAVAFQMSHKVGDGQSSFIFLKTWASIALDGGHHQDNNNDFMPLPGMIDLAAIFPPMDIPLGHGSIARFAPSSTVASKRFVFSASSIAELKTSYAEESLKPTRIEALSAFIWTRFLESTEQITKQVDQTNSTDNIKKKKMFTVIHPVNLRPKMNPPLPDNAFGNLFTAATTTPDWENRDGCYGMLRKMRESVKAVDGDTVKKQLQQGGRGSLVSSMKEKEVKGEVEWVPFVFTSLSRVPLYEVDFGWGKPVWVGSAGSNFGNVVVFIDTREGGGIEAWVHLKEADMARFEVDEQILANVSPTALYI